MMPVRQCGQDAAVFQWHVCKAEIEGDAAGLLSWQPVRVHACQSTYQVARVVRCLALIGRLSGALDSSLKPITN